MIDPAATCKLAARRAVNTSPAVKFLDATFCGSSQTRIDDTALKAIIGDAYRGAGLKPKDVDTGAVILTGEALRRENARSISVKRCVEFTFQS